ncbi:integrase core domain-containing protein [Paenibacillus lactis]|uniref:Integrase catalytic region n=1 Tax=Paenibacillus lactis 154 TaxID=743719 RepID=G4HEF5_9BACL|nr:DDE-type integrase/transposase/recombinase [Paenibacillus lactis]EHB65224.1 Integrase catalytic region [Paenibacillus lactis 154]
MRKYCEKGELGLLDQRERRKEYLDQERYVQQLKREKTMLKSVWKFGCGREELGLRANIRRKSRFNMTYQAAKRVANNLLKRDNELVLQTFAKAFSKQKDVTGLIVHSDQGFQYTSLVYHDMLPKVGAQISMSHRANYLDNASIERFFSHLKTEGLYPYDIRSLADAQRKIEKYIHF